MPNKGQVRAPQTRVCKRKTDLQLKNKNTPTGGQRHSNFYWLKRIIVFLSFDKNAQELSTNLSKYHFQGKIMLISFTSLVVTNLHKNTISFRVSNSKKIIACQMKCKPPLILDKPPI